METLHNHLQENLVSIESNFSQLGVINQTVLRYRNLKTLAIFTTILCFSTYYYGYTLAFFSTLSKTTIKEVFGDMVNQTVFHSIIIAMAPGGAFIGAMTAPTIMKFLSRKKCLLLINALALAIELIMQFPNAWILLICKTLQGFCIGNYMGMTPVYVHELSPKQINGSIGVFIELIAQVGVFVAYALGLILDASDVKNYPYYCFMSLMICPFIIIQSILLMNNYIPESPNSLIAQKKYEEAKDVILMFSLPEDLDQVFQQKRREIQMQTQFLSSNQENELIPKTQPKLKYSRIAYFIACEIIFMEQMTGKNALITEGKDIVHDILPGFSKYVPITIITVEIIGIFLAVFVLYKIGRRTLALIGNAVICVVDLIIGILFIFDDWSPSGPIIVILLGVFMFFYGFAIGSVVWLYIPEIVPAKIAPYATSTHWIAETIVIIFVPIGKQANHDNPDAVFFFLGALMFVLFMVNYFFMAETMGKTKKEIQDEFFKQKQRASSFLN